jgi:5-hydroxyisourate hydrolase-like protein (transthyretin family)
MNSDELELIFSSSFDLENSEKDVNLSLDTNNISTTGSVTGTVRDTGGNLVSGATVKVFQLDGTPLAHTVTGSDGTYTIGNLPMGIYLLSTVKDGYVMSVTMNLALTEITNASNNVIYGIVKDNITGKAIEGVRVVLSQTVDGEVQVVDTCSSISDGEYLLDNIVSGTYNLSYEKDGYISKEVKDIILTTNQKLKSDMILVSSIGSIGSTVSGQIKTAAGAIVANAFVGLYKVTDDTEELVATTYTNESGRYMFGNVANGTYVVKAKKVTTASNE